MGLGQREEGRPAAVGDQSVVEGAVRTMGRERSVLEVRCEWSTGGDEIEKTPERGLSRGVLTWPGAGPKVNAS